MLSVTPCLIIGRHCDVKNICLSIEYYCEVEKTRLRHRNIGVLRDVTLKLWPSFPEGQARKKPFFPYGNTSKTLPQCMPESKIYGTVLRFEWTSRVFKGLIKQFPLHFLLYILPYKKFCITGKLWILESILKLSEALCMDRINRAIVRIDSIFSLFCSPFPVRCLPARYGWYSDPVTVLAHLNHGDHTDQVNRMLYQQNICFRCASKEVH